MKVISGSSNPQLAQAIAQHLKLEMIDVEIAKFPNGENRIWVKEDIKGQNIVLVQSFSQPTDEHIMEFLLLADALQRAGARHINLILPWMGYSIQDKVFRDGEPIAAKVVANLISSAYIKRAFLLDLHNSSIPGFFSIPTHHLSAIDIFAEYAKKNLDLSNAIVASPDFGGLKRARTFAAKLGIDLTNIDKHRDLHTGKVEAKSLNGDVAGKTVLIFDDFINSGSTVEASAQILHENDAKSIYFFATHGLFVNNGRARVENLAIDAVITTNSITQAAESAKVKILDTAPLFADAIAAWM